MRLAAPALVLILAASHAVPAQDAAPPPPPPARGAPAAAGQGLAQVRGVLLEAAGTPAAKHQLALRADNGDLFTSGPTGVDGAFVVPGLPPGTYRLAAFGPDGTEFAVANGPVTLAAGKVERLEVRISGQGGAPGRTAPAEKGTKRGFLSSTGGKVALGVLGAAAVGLAISGSDDDDPEPVSPSRP